MAPGKDHTEFAERMPMEKRVAIALWGFIVASVLLGCIMQAPRAKDRREVVALDAPQTLSLFERIELDSGSGLVTLLIQRWSGQEVVGHPDHGEQLEWRTRTSVWVIVDESRRPIGMDRAVFDFEQLIESNEVGKGYEKIRLRREDLEQVHGVIVDLHPDHWYSEYFWEEGRLPAMMVFYEE